jgi:hypothetical protein
MSLSEPRSIFVRHSFLVVIAVLTLLPAALRADTGEPRFIRHGGAVPSEYIVKLPDGTPRDDVDKIAGALSREYRLKIIRIYHAALPGFHCRASQEAAQRLANDARVSFVEENFTGHVSAVTWPACPAATSITPPNWTLDRITHRKRISTSNSYPHLSGGEGVVAFVFDTGVMASHTQFRGRVGAGFEGLTNPQPNPAVDGTPSDPCIAYRNPNDEKYSNAGHGTAVASLLGGTTMGVAPGVTIEPVRVVDCSGGWNPADVIAGLDWIVDKYTFPSPFKGAVLNISFEEMAGDAEHQLFSAVASLKAALARVTNIGVVPFAAAGNFPYKNPVAGSPAIGDGNSCGQSIAHLGYGNNESGPHVIVSSGTDDTDNRRYDCTDPTHADACAGSQFGYGQCVDLFAPATCVYAAAMSPTDTDKIREKGVIGTSFASPMSAGAGARLLAEYSDLSTSKKEIAYKLWRMLRDTATRGAVITNDPDPNNKSPNRLLYIGAVKIQAQPQSVVVAQNSVVTQPLSVTLDPSVGAATYQWFKGPSYTSSSEIQGATSAQYSPPTDATASYWVRVTSGGLTADSMLATVTVCAQLPRPHVIATPASTPESPGAWTLSVNDPNGSFYDWYVGAPGDTNKRVSPEGWSLPTLSVTPVATNDYWVRVTHNNGCAVDSADFAKIDICAAPKITPPVDQVLSWDAGAAVVTTTTAVSVNVTGSDLSYKWTRLDPATNTYVLYSTRPAFKLFPNVSQIVGPQVYTFHVVVTSNCNDQSASADTTVTFLPRVNGIAIRNPNQLPSAPLIPLSTSQPPIVHVPAGRAIAITARPQRDSFSTQATVTWDDGAIHEVSKTITDGFRHYAQNVGARILTATATQGSDTPFTGNVSVQPCATDLPLLKSASLHLNGSNPELTFNRALTNVDVEWYKSDHDDQDKYRLGTGATHFDSVDEFMTSSVIPPSQATYWARVTADSTCGGRVTEDTATIQNAPTGRPPGSGRHRTHIAPSVNGTPTYYFELNGQPVTMTPPATDPSYTYEWRHNTNWDPTETPFSTASHIDNPDIGNYWVSTIHPDGTIDDSDITAIAPAPPAGSIPVNVYPSSRTVGGQATVIIVPHLPDATCQVNPNDLKWYQGTGYNDPAKFTPYDTDNEPSQLNLFDIPDTSTYWLEASWTETDPSSHQCTVSRSGRTELVTITVTCDPPATVNIGTNPDVHVARNDVVNLFGIGWGKLLTYTWFRGELGDKSTPVYNGRSTFQTFTADTSMWVEAVDACGNTSSSGTRIYVCKPAITTQPAEETIIRSDQTKTLSVAAMPAQSGQTLSYQWYHYVGRDTVAIPGATSPTLNVTGPSNTYWCYVSSNSCGDGATATANSQPAEVNVCAPPTITGLTPPMFVSSNRWEALHVEATGPELTYQWYRGAKGDTTNPIAGATDATYTLLPSSTATYWVRVTSQVECSIDSNAIVLTYCSAPQLSSGPTATPSLLFSGGTSTLTVSATATSEAPLHYAWYEATDVGNVLVGSDQPTFTTDALTASKTYFVRITSGTLITIESPHVTVTVCTAFPQTLGPPPDAKIAAGQLARLTGVGPMGQYLYRWYRGAGGDTSNPLGDWQSNNYVDVNPAVTTQYWYQVKDGNCISSSLAATVYVCIPTITTQPTGTMIDAGTPTTLSVAATPAGVTYQWFIGESGATNAPIGGATSASITVAPTVDTSYWVRVTGNCGDRDDRTVDSATATLAVCQKPAINQNTPGGWIARGTSYTLGVNASGTNLTYQWYSGTAGNTASPIAGGTSSNQAVSPQNTTSYWVRVSGACTPPADSGTITVRVCAIPTINTQPQSISIFSGSSTTLSVAATSGTTEPLTYQWYRGASGDQSNPVGTNAPTYTTPALTADTSYWVLVSSGTCTGASSATATVSMCVYAQTLSAPADVQAASGQSTRLTGAGVAAGNQYMWFRGASGDTSAPLTAWNAVNYVDVNPTATTQYWYRLQNGSCTSNSLAATVNVCIPTITSQPNGTMINPGASTTLSVTAITASSYQWYIGTSGTTTSPINGATSASLAVTPSSDTNYWVRVTGSCGRYVDSNTATVTVCQRPTITGNTPGWWIARGQSYTLGVSATGTNLTYQWYTGTAGNTAAPIAGGTTPNFVVYPQNTTNYWVRVSGTCTPPPDSATIPVSVCATPSITAQPQSVWIFSGATATLSVTATEATTSPVSYQWYRGTSGDASVPVGTSSPTFTTPALTTATSYWVRVSCGTCTPADSQTATVSICAYPQIISSSGDVQTSPGQVTRLQASVSNPANQYSWYQGAAGDTSHLIANGWNNYADVNPSVTTQYWGQIFNDQCVSRTNTITVTVCIPQITSQPQSITIQPGVSTTLSAAANTAGVTYQWYVGTSGTTGSPIGGATGASITVTPSATTNYWVRATSTCGRTADSATATVTLCSPPAITRQPYNAAPVNSGQTSYMDVVATGTNLTYQWYQGESGDTSVPFACGGRDACSSSTGSSFSITLYSSIRAWVRVSGMCSFANSNAVWLSVYPSISSQPADVHNVGYGSSASVEVGANGVGLHYSWKNEYGAVIPGSTDSPKVIFPSVTSQMWAYCDVTSGAATRTSVAAQITNCDGPGINSTPVYNYGGNCRMVIVNVSNPYNVSNELWYQGARGDTSHPVGSGSQLYVCPAAPTQYWCRVVGYDDGRQIECYTDTQVFTLP